MHFRLPGRSWIGGDKDKKGRECKYQRCGWRRGWLSEDKEKSNCCAGHQCAVRFTGCLALVSVAVQPACARVRTRTLFLRSYAQNAVLVVRKPRSLLYISGKCEQTILGSLPDFSLTLPKTWYDENCNASQGRQDLVWHDLIVMLSCYKRFRYPWN